MLWCYFNNILYDISYYTNICSCCFFRNFVQETQWEICIKQSEHKCIQLSLTVVNKMYACPCNFVNRPIFCMVSRWYSGLGVWSWEALLSLIILIRGNLYMSSIINVSTLNGARPTIGTGLPTTKLLMSCCW